MLRYGGGGKVMYPDASPIMGDWMSFPSGYAGLTSPYYSSGGGGGGPPGGGGFLASGYRRRRKIRPPRRGPGRFPYKLRRNRRTGMGWKRNRRFGSRKGYKRRARRFARRVRRTIARTEPLKFFQWTNSHQITGTNKETKYWTLEINNAGTGMAGVPYQQINGNANGDLLYITNILLGLTNTSIKDFYVYIDKNQWNVQLKNNMNFGVWVKSYYVKRKSGLNSSTEDNWHEIVTSTLSLPDTSQYYASDLRNRDNWTRRVRTIKTRMKFLNPGETMIVKLHSNMTKKIVRTDKLLDKWISAARSRAIIFQFTGVPLHDDVNGTTGTGAIKIDAMLTWTGAARIVKDVENTRTFGAGANTFANPVGQPLLGPEEVVEN